MATIRAVVRKVGGKIKVNQQGEALVYIQYGHDGKSFTVNTGVRIPPEAWRGDKDQSRPIGGEVKGRDDRNGTVSKYKRQLEDVKGLLVAKGVVPTVQAVKGEYEALQKKPSEPKEVDVFGLWEQYIEHCTTIHTAGTIKQKRRSQRVFADYWRRKKKPPTIEEHDISFYNAYKRFLLVDRKLNNNSAGKEIKEVKSFLNYLRKLRYPVSSDVSQFKILRERTDVVYLTQSELTQLYEHDFGSCGRLDRVRDLFVFQCCTGLR